MNLPSFVYPFGAWFFLALIPLIILYFLKLKRPRMDIPSLALWQSVVNDQRVNSPFQKFKRNILLWLQMALLILLGSLMAVVYVWKMVEAAYLTEPHGEVVVEEAPLSLLMAMTSLANGARRPVTPSRCSRGTPSAVRRRRATRSRRNWSGRRSSISDSAWPRRSIMSR